MCLVCGTDGWPDTSLHSTHYKHALAFFFVSQHRSVLSEQRAFTCMLYIDIHIYAVYLFVLQALAHVASKNVLSEAVSGRGQKM